MYYTLYYTSSYVLNIANFYAKSEPLQFSTYIKVYNESKIVNNE